VKQQEQMLRQRPDIIVATPGRLIDHLQNAPGFHLQHIEILVLDEADRCEICASHGYIYIGHMCN